MDNKEKEICEDYGFLFCDNVAVPIIRLTALGRQRRNSKSYYWDNRDRPFGFLFQYTLKGSGTLKTREDGSFTESSCGQVVDGLAFSGKKRTFAERLYGRRKRISVLVSSV